MIDTITLRQKAYDLIKEIPEEDLPVVVEYLEVFKRNRLHRLAAGKERYVASRFGVAKGKLAVPEDIDSANDEIAELFEGNV